MTGASKKGLVSIIIPTYNEAGNISPLVERLQKLSFNGEMKIEIVIVDDGSNDGTIDIIRRLMKKYNNIKLLVRPRRLGIGSAYKDGLKLASGDIIVQMDADLSHRPEYLPRLIHELVTSNVDLVIGSRYIKGGIVVDWPLHRYILSYGMCILARLILRMDIKDLLSGYRVYRRNVYEFLTLTRKAHGFADFEVEMVYLAKRHGLKVKEIPIVFIGRRTGSSKIAILDLVDVLKTVLRLLLTKY